MRLFSSWNKGCRQTSRSAPVLRRAQLPGTADTRRHQNTGEPCGERLETLLVDRGRSCHCRPPSVASAESMTVRVHVRTRTSLTSPPRPTWRARLTSARDRKRNPRRSSCPRKRADFRGEQGRQDSNLQPPVVESGDGRLNRAVCDPRGIVRGKVRREPCTVGRRPKTDGRRVHTAPSTAHQEVPLMHETKRKTPTGLEERHSRECSVRKNGARCNCQPFGP